VAERRPAARPVDLEPHLWHDRVGRERVHGAPDEHVVHAALRAICDERALPVAGEREPDVGRVEADPVGRPAGGCADERHRQPE
jgi:hypothetical protein